MRTSGKEKHHDMFSMGGITFVWGTLEDVVYLRKPTTLLAVREETENAGVALSVTTISQTAISHGNKGLDANGQHFEHLL